MPSSARAVVFVIPIAVDPVTVLPLVVVIGGVGFVVDLFVVVVQISHAGVLVLLPLLMQMACQLFVFSFKNIKVVFFGVFRLGALPQGVTHYGSILEWLGNILLSSVATCCSGLNRLSHQRPVAVFRRGMPSR